jgi:hypothetical protein
MALIWGFGAPLMIGAREKYSSFIHNQINAFFVNNCSFEFKKRVRAEVFPNQ